MSDVYRISVTRHNGEVLISHGEYLLDEARRLAEWAMSSGANKDAQVYDDTCQPHRVVLRLTHDPATGQVTEVK